MVQYIRMRFALCTALVAILFSAPFPALAAQIDLGFGNDAVYLVGSLISGKTVRLYASVRNLGTLDAEGYVQFYQGTVLVGQSQVISVRANGLADEVFVDFVVPVSSFNIRGELLGVNPADENPANNTYVTTVFNPLVDSDGDGVLDDKDNCAAISNPDQANLDGDTWGDACDKDRDGDGILDTRDNCTVNSNVDQRDLDSDGVGDVCDPIDNRPKPAPTVSSPSISGSPTVTPPTLQPTTNTPTTAPTSATTNPGASAASASTSVKKPPSSASDEGAVLEGSGDDGDRPTRGNFSSEPRASFNVIQRSWNRYAFLADQGAPDEYQFLWDFGDSKTARGRSVEHTFPGRGEYRVRLTVTDPLGAVSSDETMITISFFHFSNWQFALLLGALGTFLLILVIVMGKIRAKTE